MAFDRESRIEQICDAALALDGTSREALVAEACGDDEGLRREVESLLRQQSKADGFLSEPALVAAAHRLASESTHTLVGRQLGAYHVQSLLGTGGMGEVYRARDDKLGRDVAIKILPRLFVTEPERLARFEREARMLASLNHPHIGAIYGLENVDGAPALVLELVEGPTLADRIARGAIPVDEALSVARQIAEALEAAHEKGIVHRDLKPANITITPDGIVKVLDFGLAKAVTGDSGTGLTQSPTLTIGDTQAGAVLGTAAYMSPEQTRGHFVDKRTDIWAFGCVLYEALTGRIAFKGDTVSDTIVTILNGEPDLDALPAATPTNVCVLLQRCLEKDPKRRLRDIGDARIELDLPAPRSGAVSVATPRRESRRPSGWAVGLTVLASLLVAGATGLFYATRPSVPVTFPSEYTQLTNFNDSAVAPSLSPDGRMVTFIRGGDSFLTRDGQIYVKLLPNGESVQLTNSANRKFGPVFTPDGSRIAFTQTTAGSWDTWTVPVLGGQPTRLLPNASGLTWIADHQVLFSEIKTGIHMGIVTATQDRADSREIYIQPNEQAMVHYSYVSPDRQSVLVVEMAGAHAFTVPCRLIPFDGSSLGRQVGPRGACTSAAWSPDGEWMYFGASVQGKMHLWRQKFPDGAPEQITFGPLEEEGVAMAPDGRSLVTSIGTRRSAIWIHDAAGERAIVSEGYASAPRLSRDGTRVFYLDVRDWVLSRFGWVAASSELRSVDLASGKTESVLSDASVTDYDISRDEKEIAFTTTDSDGVSTVWLAPLDRRTPPRQITRPGDSVSFGANGELVFRSVEDTTNLLVRINRDGTGRERITTEPVLDKHGVSPDGEWVIVYSPGVGQVVPIHGGVPRKICGPGCEAGWAPDGKFFYVSTDGGRRTLAIPVPAGQSLPDLPAAGIDLAVNGVTLPGARAIEHGWLSPGPDPSTFVFTKTDLQRNLFRIPLH